MKVLLIDDDTDLVDTLTDILGDEGHVAYGASNARRGLELLAREQPGMVFVDLQLPDSAGLDLVTQIQGIAPGLPCVMMTGHADLDSALDAMERGVYNYLVKPVPPEGILALLERVAERDRLRAEREEVESDLRDSETRLRSVLETATDAIITVDDRGIVHTFNSAAEQIFGYAPEEVVGQNICRLVPEPHASVHDEYIAKYLVTGTSRIVGMVREVEARHRDGRLIPVELSVSEARLDEGRAFTAIVRDLSELRRAAAELRAERNLLQTVLDTIPHVLNVKDAQGRYLMVNRTTRDYFGLETEEIIGKTVLDLVSESTWDRSKYEALDRRVIENREVLEYDDTALKRGDPDPRYYHVTKLPFVDENQAVAGIVTLSEDMTERRQLEEQLRQAQKMEAVGQLAGGVAHDFNNLLQIISGYTQLALRTLDANHPIHGYLKDVYSATEKASGLTNQLLAFSRKQVIRPVVLDLNEVIEKLTKMLKRLIEERIDLEVRPSDSTLCIRADEGMMEQVILNLCVNARDAMPEGGRLTIETGSVDIDADEAVQLQFRGPGRYAVLRIRDTGIGMTPEVLKHLFEPFFTTKEAGKGTGLGLSVVYGIVTQHGGELNVDSSPGDGTTMSIYLPRESDTALDVPVDPTHAEFGPYGTETVLLAEDDPEVRKLIVTVLTTAGYTVLTAVNGRDALEVFDKHMDEIDLVVLDVVMPGTSGHDVYEYVHACRPDMIILFSSGYSGGVIDEGFFDREQVQLIRKPFSPGDFLRQIRELLDSGGAAGGTEVQAGEAVPKYPN